MDKQKNAYSKPELTIHGDMKYITKKGWGPVDSDNIGSLDPPSDI